MGGSEYYRAMELAGGKVPRTDIDALAKSMNALIKSIESGIVSSCHDVSSGGLAVCLAEMAIGGKGAEVCLYAMGDMRSDFKLFSESNTRWVAEVKREKEKEFEEIFDGIKLTKLGEVKGDRLVVYDGDEMKKYIDLPISTLYEKWGSTLQKIMG